MDTGFAIRIPVHMFDKIIKVNKCRKYCKPKTMTELQAYLRDDYGMDLSFEEVENLVTYADKYLRTASLNSLVNDAECETELMDFVAADTCLEDEVMQSIISEEISKALDTLSEKEHAVISMRYGLEEITL